jgi:ribosome biogenesis GTPase / thiamine phosphate phosphatase
MTSKPSKRIQQWRQQKITQQRKERADKHQQQVDSIVNQQCLGDIESGTVVAQFGKQLLIEDVGGEIHECVSRRSVDKLVCGDSVQWQNSSQGNGVVISRNPRHSELGRPNYQGKVRVIAANIDYILIVVAPEPKLDEDLINRYLIAATLTDIPALLVVNKTDLLTKKEFFELERQLHIYRELDIPVLFISCAEKSGLAQLSPYFKHSLSIVVGQSGVGKSSLIKTLLPERDIRIGKISARSRLGKHTTTAAQLYRIDRGGIVDSPGIREFGLEHVKAEAIASGFVEFTPFIGKCKFNDCSHQHEPGCAIKTAALENQGISAQRYESYLRILKSLSKP